MGRRGLWYQNHTRKRRRGPPPHAGMIHEIRERAACRLQAVLRGWRARRFLRDNNLEVRMFGWDSDYDDYV